MLVGQLATMAYGVTDTLVAGRYSETSLAALSIGSSVYVSVFVALMAVLQSLQPIWAELHGAGRFAAVGQSFRQALYLSAATMVLGIGLLLSPDALLRWTQVPAPLQGEVKQYLAILALALPPALLFRMYSTLNQSLGWPRLVTWLQIGALPVKVALSIWFGLGGLGVQAHGAIGCAWATLLVNYGLLLVAATMLKTQADYRPYRIWHKLEAPQWRQIGAFARQGIPSSLAIMVEVTSFTMMALFIARQGVVASASHQIATNLTAVMYMVPLAIAISASSRVSFWLGAGDVPRARHAIRLGYAMVAVMAVLLSATLFFVRGPLAQQYSQNPQVIAMVVPLLLWIALYHLFDGLQASGLFFLRCFRVTIAPMLVYSVLLWGGGLGGGYLLAYQGLGPWPAQNHPQAFWAASAVAMGVTALIFMLLLRKAVNRKPA